ncbi:DUF2851 family protein [Flavobacterium sp. xlx-214]|uniref:DUF2851 family protein n=1 Tax=unclassified Flavobacterium TaxID=196869 RepID=UPI0013D741E4|nr:MULTISPECIES: DUF2851 family protein [unclassified Flavobacterium]MBA5793412.1 DUF2851 family protein [Flavobacterium sp. xlx-221]QMI84028.1 DUF2851 family protein [Flavobacterium sp. xlx-214]
MKEDFLHYVWRFKKLKTIALKTVQGQELVIKDFGLYLGIQGPDFFNAQVYIDHQLWAGNVEMHVNASDWYAHHHEIDPAYQNVILHVVWNNDISVLRNDGSEIPTLVLKDFITESVFNAYNQFKQQPQYIFCEDYLQHFNSFDWFLWKEKLMIERLEQFTDRIVHELKQTKNNWEEAFYSMLLRNFGLNINSDAFYEIAKKLPFKIIRKELTNKTHVEALLLGTANLLDNDAEDYYLKTLQKTYFYLQHKYNLKAISNKITYFKLRPDNFPTIRLMQFAAFISNQVFLFDLVKNPEFLCANKNVLKAQPSAYWQTHYVFGKEHTVKNKAISSSFYNLLLINTILPFQYVYHEQLGSDAVDEILQHYQTLPVERNTTVEMFKNMQVPITSSFDSQSVLYLKKNYCDLRRCLNCEIGIKLMNQ